MIADIYKVGPLKYSKIFHCDNGSEFKGDVTKGNLPNFDLLDGKSIVWTINLWTNFSTRQSVYNIENARMDD